MHQGTKRTARFRKVLSRNIFDTEQPEIKGSGCGLVGMQERASVIGARLAMESDEHGTKMTLVAPMHVAEGKEAGA